MQCRSCKETWLPQPQALPSCRTFHDKERFSGVKHCCCSRRKESRMGMRREAAWHCTPCPALGHTGWHQMDPTPSKHPKHPCTDISSRAAWGSAREAVLAGLIGGFLGQVPCQTFQK